MKRLRKSGILLHPTSLPGPGGIGSFGRSAYEFVDFLRSAGQALWQVLPLGPTAYGNSPYSCYSAFAGNHLLINLDILVEEGDIDSTESVEDLSNERVEYARVEEYKLRVLRQAAANFYAGNDLSRKQEFWRFCDTTFWLHDYALFMSLKNYFQGKSWNKWPSEIAQRIPEALQEYSSQLGVLIGEQKYFQWQFYRQWSHLRKYANDNGVVVLGDMPIFMAHDSVDVWVNQHLFHLDAKGNPFVVAGVPPDYFSKTGQLWGNVLYDWEEMNAEGFRWWISRVGNDLALYDSIRIDHFRGFEAYWEIPKGEKTAVNGRWVKGPGAELFQALGNSLGYLPIIAEDLGVITQEVELLRDRFNFPGMKVLQFAFEGGVDNPHLPFNYSRNCVVYTGTHDNDTTTGWFNSLDVKTKKKILTFLDASGEDISWDAIRAAFSSVAELAVIPLQDILGLDSHARMNIPGKASDNWEWRYSQKLLSKELASRLHTLTEIYGRLKEVQTR